MASITRIAMLISACEQIDGRVKLQKIVHILQESGFADSFEEEFGYLHHGPYSSELKREIDQLVEWDLVSERSENICDYTKYVYEPGEDLPGVLTKLGLIEEPAWKDLATDMNKKPSQELEGISTIMFLRRRGFSSDRLRNRFTELKPHLANRFDPCNSEAEKHQVSKPAS